MCEQTEINYLEGEVVWVKLGSCWWPGEVVGPDKLPPDVLPSFRKPPIAVVKFFQEDTYEYVKNLNSIYKYNCNRKNEFINKGLYMYRNKNGHMEKFPEDVIRAEAAIGGDIAILTREEFQETKKESYADLFGDPAKRNSASGKKGRGRGRLSTDSFTGETPRKINVDKPNYKVHILVQGSPATPIETVSSETASTPSTSRAGSEPSDENKVNAEQPVSASPSIPKVSSSGIYSCHACNFSTTRLNVLILHNKTHSVTFMPYTPSPVRKKITKPSKSSPNTPKTTKPRKPRPEKTDKIFKKSTSQKRAAEDKPILEVKKMKTDEEIKSSLLADWDIDEDSNDESSVMVVAGSPEVAAPAECPAVAPPAELPETQVPTELSVTISKNFEDVSVQEKPESSSDSKYEFCEDEDWPEEEDVGRKIPRVMNPKRKEDAKSISLDDDEVAREVADFLNKTTVPELPSAPEPLKVEENFPEPSIVKSPDKKVEVITEEGDSPVKNTCTEAQPSKTIFKTKTFFRSRHSRSQDAIGKYVAEQLNAERMDISEDINGSEILPVEAPISPPIVEPVKVARLAPKIQLKKMKAEAAQLREKEKFSTDKFKDDFVATSHLAIPNLNVNPLLEPLVVKNNEEVEIEKTQEQDNFNLIETKSNSTNSIAQIEVEHLTKTDDISLDQLQDSPKEFEPFYGHIDIEMKGASELELEGDKQGEKKIDVGATSTHATKIVSHKHEENSEDVKIMNFVQEEGCDNLMKNLEQKEDNMVQEYSADSNVNEKGINDIHDQSCNKIEDEVLCKENVYEIDNKGICNEDDQEDKFISEPKNMPDKTTEGNQEISSSNQLPEPYMNESTASAVDALLSVSRETDRVTRIISNDLPEDLFEDDNKDIISPKDINGFVGNVDIETNCNINSEIVDKTNEIISEEINENKANENLISDPNIISTNECQSVENENLTSNTDIIAFNESQIDDNDISVEKASRLVAENVPSESDLQIAETLLNLPSTTIQNKMSVEHLPSTTIDNKMSVEHLPSTTILNKMSVEHLPSTTTQNKISVEHLPSTTTQNKISVEHLPSKTTQNKMSVEHLPSTTIQNKMSVEHLPSTTTQNKMSVEHQDKSIDNKQYDEEILFSSKCVALDNNEVHVDEACLQDKIEIPANHITSTDTLTVRFETEQEKSENLYAAQSLVQMSESMEHKITIAEDNPTTKKENGKPNTYVAVKDHGIASEQKISSGNNDTFNANKMTFETSSPKLLKILEEPCIPKPAPSVLTKQVIIPGKEKILNFDVGKVGVSSKMHSPKQKIIIRRSNSSHKNLLNNVTEVSSPEKIILSRSNNASQDGSSVQTYTIQSSAESPSDPNTIVIQPKVRKLPKPPNKLQKIKPSTHLSVAPALPVGKTVNNVQNTEDVLFDINSMPIVLSDDILTPESIEKMPIVMSDGNILPNSSNMQKIVKPKPTIIENEKIAISPTKLLTPKQEFKTLIVNPVNEPKGTTPNILSKSSKLRGTKMLVIDKSGGKKKIIMTKQGSHPEQTIKEIKAPPTLIKAISQNAGKPPPTLIQAMPQSTSKQQANIIQTITQNANKTQPTLMQPISQTPGKSDKFIFLPTTSSPRQGRTQKIVIDPQTGKAHMLLAKGVDSPSQINDNKSIPTKFVATAADVTAPGNTVMIITNAEGTQSRILLRPEHEKILFPNKQHSNVTQFKQITQKVTSGALSSTNKSVVTTLSSVKTPTRIVPKQKGAIITSKGQLIVGGRVATTAQNIAPLPEIRPAPKRIISGEPKKIQKNSAEPLILFQQKSGAMMQLTTAQFEHLQRTGQIVQKTITPQARESKVVLQKTINISPNETIVSHVPKPRARKQPTESPTPIKKMKHEVPIAPTPTPMPALCPISSTVASTIIPPTLSSTSSAAHYSSLENFEELLPSTAIARQPEPPVVQQEQLAPPPSLSDSQLLAVPGENFGGPQGSFYLCVEENGTFTPIDNRPLVLENNQLVPMPEPMPAVVQPERRDILEAALANSDVFHADTRDEAPDFRDLNANVSVHCRVSETSTTLNQPIMTPVEVPSKADSEPAVPSNLEDGLAVIGVTPHTVPTSLELPITVTDPRIAPKTTNPLTSNNYGTSLLTSPNTEMSFVSTEEVQVPIGGPISMPLLTEEESVGKSMPILTDDVSERILSSVESGIESPSSIDVRDSEPEDGQWPQRLLTPSSDASDLSGEIPLRPQLQLSVSDIK